MSIEAPATNPASDLALKLPATVGTAGQILKNSSTAGTLEFGDATGSSTDQFVCKAWADLSGDSNPPSLRGSYNISSVTDNGTGDHTFNFTTSLANAAYAASVMAGGTSSADDCGFAIAQTKATGSMRIACRTSRTSGKTDFAVEDILVFGVSS